MLPRRTAVAAAAVGVLLVWSAVAGAHSRTSTFAEVAFAQRPASAISWTVRVRAADLAAPLGIPEGAGPGAVLARGAEAAAYVAARLTVSDRDGGGACAPTWDAPTTDATAPEPTLRFAIRFACPRAFAALRLRYDLFFDLDELHSGFATVAFDDDRRATVIFRRDVREIVLDRPRSLLAELRAYVGLGIEHIFTGVDHLAFLAALLIAAARERPRAAVAATLRIVTAFTVAHSITLIVAAIRPTLVPTSWVEPAIALSVCWVAAENLRAGQGHRRWPLAFAFGLVHGFGFASVLREIGLPSRGLVACLLAFNLGVELGQLAVVTATLPLLLLLAARAPGLFRRGVVIGGSLALALAGAVWFVARVM